ncbi:GNAT family N-acetyltransferase [Actinomycetospora straminea]|uniref:N-acetyltransferase domain-containing protein n=1 Tax=Actinomycetospora straminea TaxID=663607 RepID=A0ABP9E0C6_9PSEU|nr:GNAT family N-acetyltransferase [Actinomycetospora straminea]MDD7934117.1 GNAT family N-acetyltransferase [Actinomycetospora straminea]
MDVQGIGATAARYARAARYTVTSGTYRDTAKRIRRRASSTTAAYGLARDLSVPHETPVAKIPISVRPLTDADVPRILDEHAEVDDAERWERHTRVRLLERGIGTPYVAVDPDDDPCYVQWLFGSGENDAIRDFFHGIFPELRADEALLEGAFTPTRHQGRRIMSAGMSMIAEKAADLGARRVLTFVGVDNIASLKGCERAGFLPAIHRCETRRFGRLRVDFRTMGADEVEQARVLKP